jgi:4,5-dihydroxyphthalate decarboxylase
MHLRVMEIMDDPLPYGIEPNRRVIDELIRHASIQDIVRQPVTVEELFAKGTRDLVG